MRALPKVTSGILAGLVMGLGGKTGKGIKTPVEQESNESKIKNAKMALILRMSIMFAWLIMLIAINPSVPRFFISFGAGLLAFSIVLYRSQDKRGSVPWIVGSLIFIAILAIIALARYLMS